MFKLANMVIGLVVTVAPALLLLPNAALLRVRATRSATLPPRAAR
jgi:hypothetical protein